MPGKLKSAIKLNGKTYFASKLTDLDIQELDIFVRQSFMESVYSTLPKNLPSEDRDQAIAIAQVTCARMTFMSGEGSRIMGTIPGMTRLTWQMLHHNHPDLTVEEVHSMLTNPLNIDEANKTFREVHGVTKGKKQKTRKRR